MRKAVSWQSMGRTHQSTGRGSQLTTLSTKMAAAAVGAWRGTTTNSGAGRSVMRGAGGAGKGAADLWSWTGLGEDFLLPRKLGTKTVNDDVKDSLEDAKK